MVLPGILSVKMDICKNLETLFVTNCTHTVLSGVLTFCYMHCLLIGSVAGCNTGISSALAMEILQSCAEPLKHVSKCNVLMVMKW